MSLLGHNSGCKVGWSFFDNEEEALAASDKAAKDRERKFAQGYDFGYQWPGAISHLPDHPVYGDCWMVIVP